MKTMLRFVLVAMLLVCAGVATRASAVFSYDWTGSVTVSQIATDVYPYQGVVFKVNGGPCPGNSGAWIYYRSGQPNDDNMKAAYAAVFAAWLSGKSLLLYVPANTCTATSVRPA